MDRSTVAGVCVPPIHEGMEHTPFANAFMSALQFELTEGKNLVNPFRITSTHCYIPQGRMDVVKSFLETDAAWLWFLDYDLVFPPISLDTMLKVIETAEPDIKILGALYFNRFDDGNLWPIWTQPANGLEFTNIPSVQLGELRKVSGIGMGCTLIHRDVFEAMAVKYAPDPWYAFGHDLIQDPRDGSFMRAGEDTTFCRRAAELGFDIYGTASVICEHIKTTRFTWNNVGNVRHDGKAAEHISELLGAKKELGSDSRMRELQERRDAEKVSP